MMVYFNLQESTVDKEMLEKLTGLADQLVATGDYGILIQTVSLLLSLPLPSLSPPPPSFPLPPPV